MNPLTSPSLRNLVNRINIWSNSRRSILSNAYKSRETWDERLKIPLLSKTSSDDISSELMQRYLKKMKVSAIDVDIFANVANRSDQIEELEHLLHKLRMSRYTINTPESTHHAVCQFYLSVNCIEKLFNVILKPIEYGIFPDHFCYNLILDHFIKSNDYMHASRVATLMALQEDFSNTITNILGLYSINQYLNDENRVSWPNFEGAKEMKTESEEGEEAGEGGEYEEEDVEYVRVPFVRNPYFDDHFDIKNVVHLCGKAMYLIGCEFDDTVGRTAQLVGLAYYSKWTKAKNVLNAMTNKHEKDLFTNDACERIEKCIADLGDEYEDKTIAEEFLEQIKMCKSKGKTTDAKFDDLVASKLELIPSLEANDIDALHKSYETWERDRDRALKAQLDRLTREEKLKLIEEKKRDLKEKEKYLFFFENFNKHEIDFVQAEQKIAEMKSKSEVEDEYIPPTF